MVAGLILGRRRGSVRGRSLGRNGRFLRRRLGSLLLGFSWLVCGFGGLEVVVEGAGARVNLREGVQECVFRLFG